MISIKYTNSHELHEMDKHKWLMGERLNRDPGEEAYFDWIIKYAGAFRAWANSLPSHCVGCGSCTPDSTRECSQPFAEERLNFIYSVSDSTLSHK